MARLTVGEKGISVLGARVLDRYASLDFTEKNARVFSVQLPRRMTNAEILATYNPSLLELGEFYRWIESLPQNLRALVYSLDREGLRRPIFVFYDAGWHVVSPSDAEVPTWSTGDTLFSKTRLV
jgi:hypothetical protein